jgi:hypothetical protein
MTPVGEHLCCDQGDTVVLIIKKDSNLPSLARHFEPNHVDRLCYPNSHILQDSSEV